MDEDFSSFIAERLTPSQQRTFAVCLKDAKPIISGDEPVVDMLVGGFNGAEDILFILSTHCLYMFTAGDSMPLVFPGPRIKFMGVDGADAIRVILEPDPALPNAPTSFRITGVNTSHANRFIPLVNLLGLGGYWGRAEAFAKRLIELGKESAVEVGVEANSAAASEIPRLDAGEGQEAENEPVLFKLPGQEEIGFANVLRSGRFVTSPQLCERLKIIVLLNSRREIAGSVKLAPDGRVLMPPQLFPNKDVLTMTMAVVAAFTVADALETDDRQRFSEWVGLPSAEWTADHRQMLLLAQLQRLQSLIRSGTFRGEVARNAVPVLRDAKLPVLPQVFTEKINRILDGSIGEPQESPLYVTGKQRREAKGPERTGCLVVVFAIGTGAAAALAYHFIT